MSRTHTTQSRSEATQQVLSSAPERPLPGRAALGSIVAILALAVCMLGPTTAGAITRPTVLARAKSWVVKPVPYSQAKYHLGYRTDCSGYVSMCWLTGTSWSTSTFHEVTHRVAVSELKPGDAMLKKGTHIRLFHNWTDGSHTKYVAYEAGTKVAVIRLHSLSTDLRAGYVPVRYNAILEGRPADDVLWNGSFDSWSASPDVVGEQPVVWGVDGPSWQPLVIHRTDVSHTGHDSMQLLAPGDYDNTPTDLSQTASVTAGAIYRMCAWARTSGDPAALQLSVRFLGADGASLGETSTSGAQAGIDDSGFRPITALATAPEGAVNAVVTVSLAAPTGVWSGPSSALVDDVSLARPRAAVSIRASARTLVRGKKISLSGSVSPTSTVGTTADVYVQRPGQGWKRLAGTQIAASGNGAVWHLGYVFKRGARKGIYRFRASVPALPGYLGQTSRTVSVTLK